MIRLAEYVNEAYNAKEAYQYEWLVKDFIGAYNKDMKKLAEKEAKVNDMVSKRSASGDNRQMHWTMDRKIDAALYSFKRDSDRGSAAFKPYPMAVASDKLGYEVKMKVKVSPRNGGTKVEEPDWGNYSKWLYDAIKDEKTTVKELAQWWYEYDNEVAKKNWCDPMWLIKQVDKTRFWNPYVPDDDSCLRDITENPISIFRYISSPNAKVWKLSDGERKELEEYYADPSRAKILAKKIKSLSKDILALQPSIDNALELAMKDLFDHHYVEDHITIENDRNVSLYHICKGETSEHERAVADMIVTSMRECWPEKKDLLQTLYSGDYKVKVINRGTAKTDHSAVVSSSFWTYYRDNFTVQITRKDGTEVYKKDYNDVVVYSEYYSGGWN